MKTWSAHLPLAQMPTPPEFRPPAGILPDTAHVWWWYMAAALVILLAAVLVWWLVRRRPAANDTATPYDIAQKYILRLQREGGGLNAEAFAVAACDVVREYFEAEFLLPATRQTSQEFLAAVADGRRVPGDVLVPLARFLEAVDIVRYGPPQSAKIDREALAQAALQTFCQKGDAP